MTTRSPTRIEFGELVRRLVLLEKRRPAATVAALLGLTQSSFYRRLHGYARFDPDQIALLLRELDDDRLRRWLFSGTRLLLVRRPSVQDRNSGMTPFERTTAAAEATIQALLRVLAVLAPSQPQSGATQGTESLIEEAVAALLSVKMEATAGQTIAPLLTDSLPNGGFGPLAAQVLLTENGARLNDLAVSLGLGYHAMRERLIGSTPFSPDELRRLFRLYPEPRLADYVMRETPYAAVPMPGMDGPAHNYDPIQAGILSLRQLITLLSVFRPLDDAPDAASPQTVTREIDAAVRHLVSLHWTATHIGRQEAKRRRYRGDHFDPTASNQAEAETTLARSCYC